VRGLAPVAAALRVHLELGRLLGHLAGKNGSRNRKLGSNHIWYSIRQRCFSKISAGALPTRTVYILSSSYVSV